MRRFALNDIGTRLVGALHDRTMPLIVGVVLGPAVVGYLGLAWRIMNLPARLLIAPVSSVLMPSLSRIQGDPGRLGAFYREALGLSAFLGFPAFLGLAAIAPELVVVAAGEKWLPAASVIQVLAIFCLMRPPSEYGKVLLFAVGEPQRVLAITMLVAVLNAVLIASVARFGLVEAAWAGVAAQAASVLLIVRAVLRRTGLTVGSVVQDLVPSLAAAGAMAVCIAAWLRHLADTGVSGAMTLGLATAAGILLYALLSLAINRRQLMRALGLAAGLLDKVRPLLGR